MGAVKQTHGGLRRCRDMEPGAPAIMRPPSGPSGRGRTQAVSISRAHEARPAGHWRKKGAGSERYDDAGHAARMTRPDARINPARGSPSHRRVWAQTRWTWVA